MVRVNRIIKPPEQLTSRRLLSPRLVWGIWGGVSTIAMPAMGEMIFGLLGVTPEDPTWGLVLLLGGLWALVAGRLPMEWRQATGQWTIWGSQGWDANAEASEIASLGSSRISSGLIWASRIAAGALFGFFYGGRGTGNDMTGAIAGVALGVGLALLGGLKLRKMWPGCERTTGMAIACCAAYGLWFWLGAWGLAALMARQGLPAVLYGGAALYWGRWAWLGLGWSRFRHRLQGT